MLNYLNLTENNNEKKVRQIVGPSKNNSWSGLFKNFSVMKSKRRWSIQDYRSQSNRIKSGTKSWIRRMKNKTIKGTTGTIRPI